MAVASVNYHGVIIEVISRHLLFRFIDAQDIRLCNVDVFIQRCQNMVAHSTLVNLGLLEVSSSIHTEKQRSNPFFDGDVFAPRGL